MREFVEKAAKALGVKRAELQQLASLPFLDTVRWNLTDKYVRSLEVIDQLVTDRLAILMSLKDELQVRKRYSTREAARLKAKQEKNHAHD